MGRGAWIVGVAIAFSVMARAQRPTVGYNDHTRTKDGALRLALEFGGGYSIAQGRDRITQTRGWDVLTGAGLNLNRYFALLGEYTFDHYNVPRATVLASTGVADLTAGVHVWSATGAAQFRYFATSHWGGYVIAGAGQFHQAAYLSDGVCRTAYCPSDYGVKIDGSSAPGIDAGAGFAWRISDNSNAKAFFEARYVRTGYMANAFHGQGGPASERLISVPVRAGLRW